MADRRMFTKKITDGDAFTSMPPTAQALYFHLCMSADDDGFSNNIRIALFNSHASTDDYNTLIHKKFILPFESGVIVIKHWKMHNYIQNDRYHETKYVEEKAQLVLKDNGAYTLDTTCIQNGYNLDTECIPRLGKVSIDKISIDKTSIDKISLDKSKGKEDCIDLQANQPRIDYQKIIDEFNFICVSLPKVKKLSDSRKMKIKSVLKEYSIDELTTAFEKVQASDFCKGDNNRGWVANFDWLMKKESITKALEGNYDNKKQSIVDKWANA